MVNEEAQPVEAEAKTSWPEHFHQMPVDDIYEILKHMKAFDIDQEYNRKKKSDDFDEFIKGFVDFITEKQAINKNRIKDLIARFFSFADIYVSVLILLYKRLDKKSSLQHVEQVANVFNFLNLLPLPSTKMYTLFERDDELISATQANLKIQYERVWLKFVGKQEIEQMSTRFLKQLLPYFTQTVIDELPNAPLSADFLFGVFNRGDIYAVWSLGGIFKLMVNHNFEYPDFYQAIYKMTTAQICYANYREEFFELLNIFLSSSHIPMYIAAAFAKKLARLLLLSKLSCQEPIMSLIRNILVRHPNVRDLLDRKEPSKLDSDPYDENELNMQKCGASQSSLWELKTLQAHWNPDVSKRANFVDRELQPNESHVRWRSDDEYFAALLERKFGKQKASLEEEDEPQAKRSKKQKKAADDDDDDLVPTNFVEPDGSFFSNSMAFTLKTMDQFGSPAQPSSVLGSSMGGQTPRDVMGMMGNPGSVMGGGSIFGVGSMMSGAGPGSIVPGSVHGGPGSVHNPGSTMFNADHRGPMSVAPGGQSTYEPGSVLQLSVPMTPLPNAAASSVINDTQGLSQMQTIMNSTAPASQMDIPQPTLQNIVSTVNLGVPLDLKKIALQARNAEFNPKRFAAVIMRIRDPRTTALIFSSGKMVCTGAKSEEASRLAARKYARIVQKLGFPAKFTEFKVQNMVGSCDVKFPIQLEGICLMHNQFSTYEPELFPGLIYRMVKPRVVLLIFVSGKVVITGAKYKKDIDEAFTQIYPILKTYKKT